MTTKSKGSSVRQKIIDLQKKTGVPYQNLETAFMIERLVARLVADTSLSKNLVFKGGFVGLRVYNSERYTIDLDALLVKSDIKSTLTLAVEKAESDLDDGVWFQFENQFDLATQGDYGGIRQTYRAGIGEVLANIKKAQVIHFDLGIGDPITPSPKKISVPSLVLKGEDLSWSVYPIETICAEKIHALITHGDINSRSKDIHDLSVFLPSTDSGLLKKALEKCFKFRNTDLPESYSKTIQAINTTSLRRGWISATSSVTKSRAFNEAFNMIVKEMIRLDRSFKKGSL